MGDLVTWLIELCVLFVAFWGGFWAGYQYRRCWYD
jgi:hypothetical protein